MTGPPHPTRMVATPIFFGICTPKLGEDEPIFDDHFFSIGLVQPPPSCSIGILGDNLPINTHVL